MARYDGLIIPRSYNEYISKSDAATLSQALKLAGVMDAAAVLNSKNPIESGAIYDLLGSATTLYRIPRAVPKDITAYYQDGTLWQRVNGTNGFAYMQDIHVGDYFQMSRPITCPNSSNDITGAQYVTIADIDAFVNQGETWRDYRGLTLIPGVGFLTQSTLNVQHFGRHQPDTESRTTHVYADSWLNAVGIGAVANEGSTAEGATINQQLKAEFGEHLVIMQCFVPNEINQTLINKTGDASGATISREVLEVQAVAMSEMEVFGAIVNSSSNYDESSTKQLAYFQMTMQGVFNRSGFYNLRNMAKKNQVCCVAWGGLPDYNYTAANFYIRPRFNVR